MTLRQREGFLGITICVIALCLAVSTLSSKETAAPVRPRGADLGIHWQLLKNGDDSRSHFARWTITNHGKTAFPAHGWTIYFNQLHLAAFEPILKIDPRVTIKHFSGDLIKLQPTDSFQPIPPGGSFSFEYHGVEAINKLCWAPAGIYIVFENEKGEEFPPELIGKVTIEPFTKPEQVARGPLDKMPVPTPAWQYEQNAQLSLLPSERVGKITPTPVVYREKAGTVEVGKSLVIRRGEGLEPEADYLAKMLGTALGAAPKIETGSQSAKNAVVLQIGEVHVDGQKKSAGSEAYLLDADAENGVVITGADSAGVFYGIQSLLQLLPPTSFSGKSSSVSLPTVHIEDAPRFTYRGQHLDVSHNFHGKESILKLLDVMAFYKLNTFHFQVSDDEGWRIEIPELPELTEISGGRAHTRNHDGVLHPNYGAGPFRNPPTFGSGFYSRKDFIEILKYAHDRHIRVIPEINLPAHARGAIIAMKAREKRLMAEGKTEAALEYRLHDPDDTSRYISAQGFLDNAVCVVDEPVYHFAKTIIRNFEEMFAEAGVPLDTWHFGADEVPQGVWTKSPRCAEFLKAHPEFKGPADLKNYFVRRMLAILKERKLQAACWQEAALDHVTIDGKPRDNPIPEFAGGELIPYVWNNTRGNEDLCNRFANIGYPVILCSVSNLYYDLAYSNDPLEPGLTWGGFIDARSPFEFVPEDVFKSTKINNYGHTYDRPAMYAEREKLTPQGLKNVLGIQGQIWCETIKGPKLFDYYVFPKIISLAERAWAAQPAWAKIDDLAKFDAAVQEAWNEFANRLGQRELPRMDVLFSSIEYRLPPPGAMIKDGKLYASSEYPGLTIRYATEGHDPTAKSPLYEGPVAVKGPVKLSTTSANGRVSRAIAAPASP